LRLLVALAIGSGCASGVEAQQVVAHDARIERPAYWDEPVLAFVDVNVVAMDSGTVLPHRTVIVAGDRIVDVGEQLAMPPHATRIVATGKYLIPGLADMHVHVDGTRGMLASFVGAGVTTVRNMAGSPRVLALRQRIAKGELLGPTIITAGPFVDGPHPRWEGSEIVKTPADAERVVAEQAAAGYDLVKIYNGLQPAAYDAVLAAAKAHGLRAVGHVPFAVPLAHVLEAGQVSIEHLSGYARAIERADAPTRHHMSAATTIRRWQYADPARITAIAADTARHGVWNCPTLVTAVVYGELWRGHVPAADLDTVSPDWRARWDPTHSPKKLKSAVRRAMVEAHDASFAAQLAVVRELAAAGAPLLAGTDTPNPYVVPGASLHQELALFVEAGLSPYAALRTATVDAATFLGDPHAGLVATGMRADLVMLDADPLVDIHALDGIEAVVVRGTYLSHDKLRSLHDEIVAEYREPAWQKPIDLGPATRHFVVADNGVAIGAYALARDNQAVAEKQTLEDETISTRLALGVRRVAGLALDIERPEGHVLVDHARGRHPLVGWLTPATAATIATALDLAIDQKMSLSIDQPDPDAPELLRAGDLAVTRTGDRSFDLRITIDRVSWQGRLVLASDHMASLFRLSSTTRPVVRTWTRVP
jgi:imidazolonepropionase-like amidohydrolase